MEFEDLFTEKTTVEISVVKINNQKLTKSICNQLKWHEPFDKNLKFIDCKIFGYVNTGNDTIGIASTKNYLFRFKTDYLRAAALAKNLNINFFLLDQDLNIENIVGLECINRDFFDSLGNFYSDEVSKSMKIKDVLTDEGQKVLIEIAEKAETFLKILYKRQIIV